MNTLRIKERLQYIEVLSSLEVSIKRVSDDAYEYTGHVMTASVNSGVMSKDVVDCDNNSRHGELVDAVVAINKAIKEAVAPIISKQKALIAKELNQ